MFQKIVISLVPLLLFFGMNLRNGEEFVNNNDPNSDYNFERLYFSLNKNDLESPKLLPYKKAMRGFFEYKFKGLIKGEKLVIIDFSLPSTQKRLWVIDFATNSIIYHTLVSHGKGTGNINAYSFSNEMHSNKSSLGFYLTGETYIGKHGISLKLDGLEFGLNDKARERAVVIHGAEYVSRKLANKQGYLGRSQGCPAVATAIAPKLIQTIKNKSVLFIYHPTRIYVNKSKLVS